MNLGELLAELYDDLNVVSTAQPTPPALVTTRYTRWINLGLSTILRKPGLVGLRDGTLTFATVANQKTYAIPEAFEKWSHITDPVNGVALRSRTKAWLRRIDPQETSFGTPECYVPFGQQPVRQQPGSTGLWVASSAAGDTTQTARVVGVRANGDKQAQATAALNGATRVQVGAITDYASVIRFDLSAVGVGTISLYDAAAAGNELARIPIGSTAANYEIIRLWPTITTVQNYTIDGRYKVLPLVNTTDVPMLPDSFHDLLSIYARFREYKKTGDRLRMEAEWSEFTSRIEELMAYVEYDADYLPIAGQLRDGQFGWSNLGGWFPADGWGRG